MILLFISTTTAFASSEKFTKKDYTKKLNEYIEESNKKFQDLFKQYNSKVKANEVMINKLEDEKQKAHKMMLECHSKQDTAWFREQANGPCGRYMGKTTYFKTSSGIVVADDWYAFNKCLEKLPKSRTPYVDHCSDKYDKINKEIEFYNNKFSVLENEKKDGIKKIETETENKVNELLNDCKRTYPKKAIFGYCSDLAVNFVKNN